MKADDVRDIPQAAGAVGPLAGVRITDFTWIGAGSYTTKLLADMGADVVKIETAVRPDTLRMMPPFKDGKAGLNRSGYFADRNSSKRSIALNMKHPKAQAIARRMIARSEAVTNNFTPGVMAGFGLGWEDVRAFKPGIVYLAMSLLGDSGPERDYLGYGLMINAMSGILGLSGNPGQLPAGTGTNYPDHIPNPTHAAVALMAALRHLRRTGEGQCVDMSQLEPAVCLMGPTVLDWSANGHSAHRRGNQHPVHAPHGVYPVRGEDRWISIAAMGDTQWSALARVLGQPAWLDRPEWLQAAGRRAQASELDARVAEATARHDGRELMEALQAEGVAAGLVLDCADVITDRQLVHQRQWATLDHPEMGPSLYSTVPLSFSATPARPYRPAPLLGQHTAEVCKEWLGLDDGEIQALAAEDVLK